MSTTTFRSAGARQFLCPSVTGSIRSELSQWRVVLKIAAAVFIVEANIMLLFPLLPQPVLDVFHDNIWLFPLTDAALLVAVVSPIALFWAIRPYVQQRDSMLGEISDVFNTLDLMPASVTIIDPATLRFTYMNRTALARLGWSEHEYRDKSPVDALSGVDEKSYRKLLEPLFKGKESKIIKERYDCKGNPIRVSYQIVRPAGATPSIVAIAENISEQKAAEEESRLLSQSLDLIQDEVYLFWPDSYEFIYLNEAAARRAAAEGRKWRGRKVGDFVSPSQLEALKKRCKSLIEGPERCFSYEMVDKNKRVLEIYLHLVEPEGSNPRFLAIYRDISEHKIAEKAKSEFVSTVSHELRTPLTSIKGALGLIEAGVGGELPEKVSKLVTLASKNSDRLMLLINDLLDIEKMQSGQIALHKEPVDVADLVFEVIEANQAYASQYGVTFVASQLETGLCINGDRSRLRQVLDNLVSNAAKFSDKGQKVELSATTENGHVIISVQDHGTGIPPEAQGTIFERFTQADSSDQRRKGGTGLGLSISRSIVDLHGGRIHFDSEVGKGTTFFVELPGCERQAA